MNKNKKGAISFFVKVIITHVITYMVVGAIASQLLNYEDIVMDFFGFKPMDEIKFSTILLGQILRGFLLGMVIWWIKDSIINKKLAWLKLFVILVILGIFNTYGPAHGSIEGLIYLDTSRFENIPFSMSFSILEVLIQPLLFSIIVCTNWKELHNNLRKNIGKKV